MVSQVGWSVSRALLFLTGDRTFTSRVLNPAAVHGDGMQAVVADAEYKGKWTSAAAVGHV
jgi:hypothetical protein